MFIKVLRKRVSRELQESFKRASKYIASRVLQYTFKRAWRASRTARRMKSITIFDIGLACAVSASFLYSVISCYFEIQKKFKRASREHQESYKRAARELLESFKRA